MQCSVCVELSIIQSFVAKAATATLKAGRDPQFQGLQDYALPSRVPQALIPEHPVAMNFSLQCHGMRC